MNQRLPHRPAVPRHHRRAVFIYGLAILASLALTAPSTAPRARAAEADAIPPNAQSAIDHGLAWLAHEQNANGAWRAGDAIGDSAAVTSLAVMAFLARGHVPGQGPYGDQLNRGIDWVLSCQSPSGVISAFSGEHTMYDHGISTVMLCEIYAMVDEARRPKVEAAVGKAVKLILDAQKIRKPFDDEGGWRYTPTSSDSDISVTGWQLMALRGAANVGAAVPKSALDAGIAYIHRLAVPQGGFSYASEGRSTNRARAGTGIVSLQLLGQIDSPDAVAAGDYLLRTPQSAEPIGNYFYGVYYCSQAANLLRGHYWSGLYPAIRQGLVLAQNPDGYWTPLGIEAQGGSNYATAMAVLALSVPYRYLPLYQR